MYVVENRYVDDICIEEKIWLVYPGLDSYQFWNGIIMS